MAQKASAQLGRGLLYRLRQALKNENIDDEASPPINHKVVQMKNQAELRTSEQADRHERLLALTRRERELLLLLLDGCTLKEAAGALSVQYSTANTHMTSLYKKLGVTSRPELIIRYRELCMMADQK